MRLFASLLFSLSLVPSAHAMEVFLRATPTLGVDQTALLKDTKQTSEGTIDGAGDRIQITYMSSHPLHLFVAPFNSSDGYNPGDLLYAELPAGDNVAIIDVTATTSWTPLHNTYYMQFVSTSEKNDADFRDMKVLPASFITDISIGIRHLFTPEPMQVSIYHELHGPTILGYSGTLILGIFMMILCVVAYLWKRSIPLVGGIVLCGLLLSNARGLYDASAMSIANLRNFYRSETYGLAGSYRDVAEIMRMQPEGSSVSVCSDAADYLAKMLRYELYPIPVKLLPDPKTTHVLIYAKTDWSYEQRQLTCGVINASATLVKTFADHSQLFRITR